jgi:peptidoglycan-associated lipoprotein
MLETYNKTFEIPNIEFEFGSKELTPLAKYSLDSLTQVLNDNPNIIVELAAHTDMIGSEENNMILSHERAKAVRLYLISRGILAGRLTTVGYGESRPIEIEEEQPRYDWLKKGDVLSPEYVENLTDEQQEVANQLNRRTELRVIAHDFVPSLD